MGPSPPVRWHELQSPSLETLDISLALAASRAPACAGAARVAVLAAGKKKLPSASLYTECAAPSAPTTRISALAEGTLATASLHTVPAKRNRAMFGRCPS